MLRFRYRTFLSKEQVDQLARPSPDTVELVSAWLEHNGIRSSSISRTHGGTSLTISDLRVTHASELLCASYQLYRNMKTNETIIRAVGYSPPEVLHRHVQTAMPATCFSSMEVTVQTPQRRSFGPAPAHMQAGSMKLGAVEARQPPAEPIIVVPESLRSLYGTVEYVPSPAAYGAGQNSLAVVANRLPSQQDLTTFMDRYQEQDANGATFNIQIVDWIPPNLGELPDERSNVVVQYATAVAYPTPLFVFRIAQDEVAFAQLLHFLLGMEPVPRTIGISFNYFFEYNLPMPDAVHLCELLEQFGARGSSVLVASGDHGVGAPEDCDAFHVEFPSSCTCDVYHPFQALHKRECTLLTIPCFAGPWVTSVGGTQSMHSESMHPEIATPRSGGGFSSYFDRPDYQGDAVPEYLDEAEESIREYEGLYECAPYYGLTFSYFSIRAAFMAVATPTSPRKRSVVVSTSTVLPPSRLARPAQFRCVFPYSLLRPLSVVHYQAALEHPAYCLCLDSGGYNLAAQ